MNISVSDTINVYEGNVIGASINWSNRSGLASTWESTHRETDATYNQPPPNIRFDVSDSITVTDVKS